MDKTKKIAIIGGARPNFMKVAPLCHEFARQQMPYILINTGQHFSKEMADDFFVEFGIKPHHALQPAHTSPVAQMSEIMQGLEGIFTKERPDLVLVVGDVNSTLAAALVANKMKIPLAHIEAGLRSHNWKMAEETNRVLTDRISNFLFVTEEDGEKNLRREGITKGISFVGNIMMDTLCMFVDKAPKREDRYYFVTMHRPENVDQAAVFSGILDACEEIAKDALLYLPLHPRTKKMAETFGYLSRMEHIFTLLPPLSYTETLSYQKYAELVLTDSAGIQEETSFLGVPCLTIRTETERPITVTLGTNTIAGVTKESILHAYTEKERTHKKTSIPLWDGKTSERIVQILSI